MSGKILSRVSLAATLSLTSHAEYVAGVASGLPLWHPFGAHQLGVGLPWLLPVAIDCYVVDALERRKGMDRWAALGILAASVIGGSAYTATTRPEALRAAGVGVIIVLVLSRLYAPVRPSKQEADARAVFDAAQRAEEDRALQVEQRREQEAARLRIEEADHLARWDADRVLAAAEADGLRIHAEAAAEATRLQAAAELAKAEADRVRTESDAEIARVQAESTAALARIQAEAEARRPRASVKQSTNRPRTAQSKPSKTPTSGPSKDEAARLVAEAIRAHQGPKPYVFDWEVWAKEHGGSRSHWFSAKQAAEQGPHLATAAG